MATMEKLLSGDYDLDLDDAGILSSLTMVDQLLGALRCPSEHVHGTDLQQLQLPPRSQIEAALAKYPIMGQAVKAASAAISSLPFSGPVGTVLEAVYGRAEQVSR